MYFFSRHFFHFLHLTVLQYSFLFNLNALSKSFPTLSQDLIIYCVWKTNMNVLTKIEQRKSRSTLKRRDFSQWIARRTVGISNLSSRSLDTHCQPFNRRIEGKRTRRATVTAVAKVCQRDDCTSAHVSLSLFPPIRRRNLERTASRWWFHGSSQITTGLTVNATAAVRNFRLRRG